MSNTCADPFTVILVKLEQKKLWLNKRIDFSTDGLRPEVPKALQTTKPAYFGIWGSSFNISEQLCGFQQK